MSAGTDENSAALLEDGNISINEEENEWCKFQKIDWCEYYQYNGCLQKIMKYNLGQWGMRQCKRVGITPKQIRFALYQHSIK